MKRKWLLAFILLLMMLSLRAQQSRHGSYKGGGGLDEFSVGVGLGLDYGGLGATILYYPQENIGLFGGAGYALAGLGYNVGGKIRFNTTSSSITPYLIGMYGYNAAIAVPSRVQYDKLFYGPSFGFGIDRESNRGNGYWSYAILIPIRAKEVDDYINSLKAQNIVLQNSLFPITISIGYHFIIK